MAEYVEGWDCIVLCRGRAIPVEADLILREVIRRTLRAMGLEILWISSGWGLTEEEADRLSKYVVANIKRERVMPTLFPEKVPKITPKPIDEEGGGE